MTDNSYLLRDILEGVDRLDEKIDLLLVGADAVIRCHQYIRHKGQVDRLERYVNLLKYVIAILKKRSKKEELHVIDYINLRDSLKLVG